MRIKRFHSPPKMLPFIPCGASVTHLALSAGIRDGLYSPEVKTEFKS